MVRPLAALALVCPLLVTACGDDSSSGQSDSGDAGSTGGGASTGEGVTGSGEASGSTDDSSDPDTGTIPQNCVVQQGEGPCMIETVIPVPSPELVFGDFDDDGDIDILARPEGTTFCLLLPHTDIKGARAMMERVLGQVADRELVVGDEEKVVRAAAGLCEYRGDGISSADELNSRARVALRKAWRLGGNCPVVWTPDLA